MSDKVRQVAANIPILFPGESVAPGRPREEDVPPIDNIPLDSFIKRGYFEIDIKVKKSDPTLIFEDIDAPDQELDNWWVGGRSNILYFGRSVYPDTRHKLALVQSATKLDMYLYSRNISHWLWLWSDDVSSLYYTAGMKARDGISNYEMIHFQSHHAVTAQTYTLAFSNDATSALVFGGAARLLQGNLGDSHFWKDMYLLGTQSFNFAQGAAYQRTAFRALGFDDTNIVYVGPTNATGQLQLFAGGANPRLSLDGSEIKVADWVRHTSSSYRRYYHLSVGGFDPGVSGATWTDPGANHTGGWRLNAVGETLIAGTDIHADWDGVSDIMVEILFVLNVAGSADDTVDLKMICYYNGVGDTATKTQTVEVATVTDGTQYKVYKAEFAINFDEADNVVDAGDNITFILNLETDTSEIDDIIVLHGGFYYNTTHIGIESGDI